MYLFLSAAAIAVDSQYSLFLLYLWMDAHVQHAQILSRATPDSDWPLVLQSDVDPITSRTTKEVSMADPTELPTVEKR